MNEPYRHPVEDVLSELNTDSSAGLSEAEAERQLQQFGPNELIESGRRSAFGILFDQLKEVMVVILILAAVISLFLHEYIDAVVILIIVILNTALGFWQEFNAENAIAALKKLAVPNIRVRRGGTEKSISTKDLVPGDIMMVEAGNIVPADARLIDVANLKVQEATLTGESLAAEKNTEVLDGENLAPGDRKNMIFMGTVVTYGRAQAVVTATGMQTELGNIANMLQVVDEEQAPLQRRLARLGSILSIFAMILIGVVALMTYLQGAGLKEMFMTAISMAVAAIPEGLPAVVTIALALGARRMLKQKSLIRHLPAVETLGSVTVICSDKTGTLTQNQMTVTDIVLPDKKLPADQLDKNNSDPSINLLLLAGLLCNDAVLTENEETGDIEMIGDPTEGALLLAAEKAGLPKNDILQLMPRIAELPFDSERKRMTTIHKLGRLPEGKISSSIQLAGQVGQTDAIAFTKGSVDGLIEICAYALINGKIMPLTDDIKRKILADNTEMAQEGVRVLGAGFKFIDSSELNQTDGYETHLVYLGMISMLDPVRSEAVDAIRLCKKAGIRVVMITGDHPLTASAIARELGISADGRFLSGQELSGLSVEELKEQIDEVNVFARVSPQHKMVIIDALQEKNQIVAMTGDGVNDAPALKSADIGVAMGITGTDVAREASDMVLLDDNFATIVSAVKEGRTIFDNIRKFVKYILTGNAGEILVMLIGPLLGMPIPLFAIQILWINLVTDGIPAIALGYEDAEKDAMKRPPFKPQEGIFSRGIGRQILMMGLLIGGLSIAVGYWFWQLHPDTRIWQTMIFTTLTFCQMAYALGVRRSVQSVFTASLLKNKIILFGVGLTFILQLILIYVPFFNTIFRTVPLNAFQFSVCLAAALIVILATEIEKIVHR
ncbi:cation-translocating P-type ATPase [candidate division KSB1 bacterium]|nr:cation-translocating P-type ATPase [candidate division KSB1 bacterium]